MGASSGVFQGNIPGLLKANNLLDDDDSIDNRRDNRDRDNRANILDNHDIIRDNRDNQREISKIYI